MVGLLQGRGAERATSCHDCGPKGSAAAAATLPIETCYCNSSPAFLTRVAYLASSLLKNEFAYSVVLTSIVFPCFAIASFPSGVANAAANASWMLFTSAGCIFAGPITANQPSTR